MNDTAQEKARLSAEHFKRLWQDIQQGPDETACISQSKAQEVKPGAECRSSKLLLDDRHDKTICDYYRDAFSRLVSMKTLQASFFNLLSTNNRSGCACTCRLAFVRALK